MCAWFSKSSSNQKDQGKKKLDVLDTLQGSGEKEFSRDKSDQLFVQAKKLFPGGVNSPVRSFSSVLGSPIFIKRGKDSYLFDEDGNRYIDYCCSWGALINGHCDENVVRAIQYTATQGTSFGASTVLENELAELILSKNRKIQKIRFVNSGTEAVMSAIRLARGYTGKSKVIKFMGCYHGHVDGLLVKAGSGLADLSIGTSDGLTENLVKDTIVAYLKDKKNISDAISSAKDDLAAVIIEPVPANNGLISLSREYLEHVRAECTKHGALLIFDEVISGFRIGSDGAAGYFNIQPDIITFGKIIGGGLPVGAFGASTEIMSKVSPLGGVYQAGTLSGNPLAMAAGIAALQQLNGNVYKRLAEETDSFVQSLRHFCKAKNFGVKIYQIGSIFWISFNSKEVSVPEDIEPASIEKYKIFHNFLLEHGIYFPPSAYEVCFLSTKHNKIVLEKTKNVIFKAFEEMFGIK